MARMAWRNARLATVLALGGLACGRTEWVAMDAGTETASGTAGTSGATVGLDTGGFDTGRPTSGVDTGGPISVTVTFTTGFDSGVLDTGFDEVTGFPGTSSTITTGVTTEIDETGFPGTGGTTTGTSETSTTTTTTTTATSGPDTDGGTTSGGSTDGGTTSGGSTDGGTTSGGTTDGGTTGGGDLTCLDAVDCVLGCGGASFSCIGQCNDGLTPEDAAAFNDLETCIIFACIFNGSCGFDFGSPGCVACRIDGQLDPATLACDDEAAACTG